MNSRLRTGAAAAALLGLAACRTLPHDPYAAGHRAMAQGDVVRAIAAFDAVPFADPRHPEARLHAAALERRLQRQLELMLLGLSLRQERQDEAALAAFESAREAWGGLAAAQGMVQATRTRIAAARRDDRLIAASRQREAAADGSDGSRRAAVAGRQEPRRRPAPPVGAEFAGPDMASGTVRTGTRGGDPCRADAATQDTVQVHEAPSSAMLGLDREAVASVVRSLPIVDPVAAWPRHVPAGPAGRAGAANDETAPIETAPGSDAAAATRLASLEAALAAGNVDQVMPELFALHETYPGDLRVRARIARLLQQRGLLGYGQGNVQQAVADWQRALQLDPTLTSARAMLESARAELASPMR